MLRQLIHRATLFLAICFTAWAIFLWAMLLLDDEKRCPRCGLLGKPVKILYGYPGWIWDGNRPPGDWVHGGCCISPDSPEWHCLRCRTEWGRAARVLDAYQPNRSLLDLLLLR
jgi:hypothetical protein